MMTRALISFAMLVPDRSRDDSLPVGGRGVPARTELG